MDVDASRPSRGLDELARRYRPQRALLVAEPPRGADWLHELELDGHRAGAALADGAVRLLSRRGSDRSAEFPELTRALRGLKAREALLDGEIVAHDERGLTYVAFDLLWLDGEDLAPLPLEQRKQRLAALLAGADPALRLSEHFDGDGPQVYRRACELGAEGVVSKRRYAAYQAGARNASWQHVKCSLREAPARRPPPAEVAGVALKRPGLVIFPACGLTRLDVARFYEDIADWLLPHVAHRPMTLVRCHRPIRHDDALHEQCEFLRHTPERNAWLPDWVPRLQIPEQKKLGEYVYVDALPALMALVSGGVLELHVWNARVDDVERPDRIVFDLDPGEGASWQDVVDAARLLRSRLRSLGLESWPKVTGGKGLHVAVPFVAERGWDEVFAFSRAVAEWLVADAPGLTTSFKKPDRAGKILVDYKRNHRTSIAVAGFSIRARPHAPVAVPIAWRELGPRLRPDQWTVRSVRQRLSRLRSDPWAGYWQSRQRLPATIA